MNVEEPTGLVIYTDNELPAEDLAFFDGLARLFGMTGARVAKLSGCVVCRESPCVCVPEVLRAP